MTFNKYSLRIDNMIHVGYIVVITYWFGCLVPCPWTYQLYTQGSNVHLYERRDSSFIIVTSHKRHGVVNHCLKWTVSSTDFLGYHKKKNKAPQSGLAHQ